MKAGEFDVGESQLLGQFNRPLDRKFAKRVALQTELQPVRRPAAR